jgi:DNA-binding NarL/FixJ family response regulator
MMPNCLPTTKPLTPRERTVLQLIWEGLSSQEIAAKIGRSVRTIDVHRASIMKKLRARNVAQVLRQALQLKLIKD